MCPVPAAKCSMIIFMGILLDFICTSEAITKMDGVYCHAGLLNVACLVN